MQRFQFLVPTLFENNFHNWELGGLSLISQVPHFLKGCCSCCRPHRCNFFGSAAAESASEGMLEPKDDEGNPASFLESHQNISLPLGQWLNSELFG